MPHGFQVAINLQLDQWTFKLSGLMLIVVKIDLVNNSIITDLIDVRI